MSRVSAPTDIQRPTRAGALLLSLRPRAPTRVAASRAREAAPRRGLSERASSLRRARESRNRACVNPNYSQRAAGYLCSPLATPYPRERFHPTVPRPDPRKRERATSVNSDAAASCQRLVNCICVLALFRAHSLRFASRESHRSVQVSEKRD